MAAAQQQDAKPGKLPLSRWGLGLFVGAGAAVAVGLYYYHRWQRRSERRGFEGLSAEEVDKRIRTLITTHPDFPRRGMLHRDISPVLRSSLEYRALVNLLLDHVRASFGAGTIEVVVGLEPSGFIFGPLLAMELKCSFVPFRSVSKLPGELVTIEFEAEEDRQEVLAVQKGAIEHGDRVIIVDDVLAIGQSMMAACKLAEKCGAIVRECLTVVELREYDARSRVRASVHSLFEY
jgi:adenine phosphoribosyltransferase